MAEATTSKTHAVTKPQETPRKSRKAISVKVKMDIIKQYENGATLTEIANRYGANRSTIATILKHKERIKKYACSKSSLIKNRLIKIPNPLVEKLEDLLSEWITHENLWKDPLDRVLIQQRAISIYESLKESFSGDLPTFHATNRWFRDFKFRHEEFVERHEGKPQNKRLKPFVQTLADIITENGYSSYQVFHLDELEILWKSIPLQYRVMQMSKLNNSNDKVSVLLGFNAAADCHLTPLLVHHTEDPPELRNVTKSSLPVVWASNQGGYISARMFKEWFFRNFIPEVQLYCKTKEIPFKILLYLKSVKEHPLDLDDYHPNIKVIYAPTQMNNAIIPMRHGISEVYLALYIRKLLSDLLESIERAHPMKIEESWDAYNIYNCVKSIKYCWDELATTHKDVLISAWQKSYPQFVQNYVNPKTTKLAIDQDIEGLAKYLQRILTVNAEEHEQEGITVVPTVISHNGNEILIKEEITEIQVDNANDVLNSSISSQPIFVNGRQFDKRKMAEAFQKIDDALKIFESMDPNCSRFTTVEKIISDALSNYRKIYRDENHQEDVK